MVSQTDRSTNEFVSNYNNGNSRQYIPPINTSTNHAYGDMVDHGQDQNNNSRRSSTGTIRGPLPKFIFPPRSHLLITTSSSIYKMDSSNIHPIFRSCKGGIVSAKEATNGTGLLAVADGYVVILRRKGDVSRRHRLKSVDGQLGLLAFANNSKDLIFSTALQASLHCFSIKDDQILDFHCTHPSPPTALAVSVDSTYVISASPSPPVVYLQDLTSPGRKINFKPKQSHTAVTVASFHPERNEIFLLGYADGTISVHTASRIVLMRAAGSDGCLGHLKRAHRLTNTHSKRRERRHHHNRRSSDESATVGDRSVGITAASFVSGYHLRTVSVAGDGKCKVVEFEKGANLIRCWSVQAACACLAVYTYLEDEPQTNHVASDRIRPRPPLSRSVSKSLSSEPNYIIAIGRDDGALLIFDAAGLLRSIEYVGRRHHPLLDLAWISKPRDNKFQPSVRTEPVETVLEPKNNWSFRKSTSPKRVVKISSPEMKVNVSLEGLKDGSDATEFPSIKDTSIGQENQAQQYSLSTLSKKSPASKSSPRRLLDCLKQKRFLASPSPVEGSVIDTYTPARDGKDTIPSVSYGSTFDGPEHIKEESPTSTKVTKTSSRAYESLKKRAKREKMGHRMPCSWVEGSSSAETFEGPGSPKVRPMQSGETGFAEVSVQQKLKSPRILATSKRDSQRLRRASGLPTATMLAKNLPNLACDMVLSDDDDAHAADIEDLSSAEGVAKQDISSALPINEAAKAFLSQGPQNSHSSEVDQQMLEANFTRDALAGDNEGNQPDGFAESCDYTCADVIREEMALVRGEIASLRKGLLVFGSRIETGPAALWSIKEWETPETSTKSIQPGEAPTFSE